MSGTWYCAQLFPSYIPSALLEGTKGTAPLGSTFKTFIESVSLNPDGTLALLGLNDGTAAVFNVGTSQRISLLHVPGEVPASKWSLVRSVSYSADGSLLAVGFSNRTIGVWNATGEQRIGIFRQTEVKDSGSESVRPSLTTSVAISNDNKYLLGGFADGTCVVWALETAQLIFEAVDYAEDIISLTCSLDIIRWATSGGSVWEVGKSQPEKILSAQEPWREAAFNPLNSDDILVRTQAEEIRGWDVSGTVRTHLNVNTAGWSWPDDAKLIGFGLPEGECFFG